MTQEPKKLPPWMRDQQPHDQEDEPTPPPGGDDEDNADLPPWLREDAPPPPPKVKRVAPPAPEQTGDLPPWLAGIDEPKSYKIGGTELPEEYFAAGDQLAETVDSELTFDAWMADQLESKRVKDIEEEVPDLFSSFESAPEDAAPSLPDDKSTGQLPDWFLGLEELDTTDAPEWFDAKDASSAPQSEVPPWINQMLEEEPAEEPPPADEVGSFFDAIGGAPPDEDDVPEIDWYDEEPADVAARDLPTTDFFNQLVGRRTRGEAAEPETPAENSALDDFFTRLSSDDQPDWQTQDEEIPVEDFFTGLGGAETDALPGFTPDDPPDWQASAEENPLENDFFAELGNLTPEDQDDQPAWESSIAEEMPTDDFYASLGSLTSAEQPADEQPAWQPPMPQVSAADDFADFDDILDQHAQNYGAVEIPQNELDAFFDNFTPGRDTGLLDDIEDPELDWVVDAQPELQEIAPEAPEQPAADPEETMSWLNELESIVSSVTRPLPPLEPEEPVSFEVEDTWKPPVPTDVNPAADDFDWPEAPVAEAPAPEEVPESNWLDAISPDEVQDMAQADQPEESRTTPGPSLLSSRLRGKERPPRRFKDEDKIFALPSGDPEQDALIPEHELNSGWLTDDLLSSDQLSSGEQADESTDADFFSLLETNADANVLGHAGDTDGFTGAEPVAQDQQVPQSEALSDADFMEELSVDSPDEALPQTDDFFAGLNDEDQQQAQPGALEDDALAQWAAQQQASELPQTDDFFAQLNLEDAEAQPAEDPLAWLNQPDDQEQSEDDFLARLNVEDSELAPPADESLAWLNAADVEMPQTDDFFAGLNDEDQQPAQPAEDESLAWMNTLADQMPQTDELVAQFTVEDDQPAQPVEDAFAWLTPSSDEQEQPDDNFSAPPAQESLSWMDRQADEQGQPEDDLLARLGIGDTEPEQPVEDESLAWMNTLADQMPQTDELLAQFDAEDNQEGQPANDLSWMNAVDDQMPQTDELLAQLGIDDGQSAQPEDESLAWMNQQDAEIPEPDDFFTPSGAYDADAVEPSTVEADDGLPSWIDQLDEQPSPDSDFYESLGIESSDEDAQSAVPEAQAYAQWGNRDEDELPDEDDFFASLGDEPGEEAEPQAQENPLAQWASDDDLPPAEDFFSALGMIQDDAEPVKQEWGNVDEEPPEEDFFSALGMIGSEPPEPEAAPQFVDIDSYLDSLTAEGPEVGAETDEMFERPADVDMETLFSGVTFTETPQAPEQASGDILPAVNEDWLANLQASVEEVSASAIVRQKEDRPVEELTDRLRKLRRRAEDIPDEAPSDEALSGVPSALAPAPFAVGVVGQTPDVALTPEQQAKVDLLKSLVPVADAPKPFRMSAIEATYDSPFMADLEDTDESIVHPPKPEPEAKPQRSRRRRQPRPRPRLDRLLIVVILAAAVILPFVAAGFRVGDLPPQTFAAGSAARTAFDQLDAVPSGALVLVGVEYNPASAAELDGVTDALVRHILMRAAFPVIVSSNPLALLRSETLFASINADDAFLQRIGASEPLQPNRDYYLVRYLPGSVIGLRAFSEDTANLLLSDIRGQASNLVVRSMREFALVAVITDRAEDLRAYAEQIAPLARAPLVSAVSYSAAPLAEPYALSLGGGLLVGYGDAYTYAASLGLVAPRSIAEQIRVIPTNTPAPTLPATATLVEPTRAATVRATSTKVPPTATPEPQTATVISRQSVNMRSGPSTDNGVLAGVPSGASVLVLGFNDDQTWVNVRLEDGREGWISAALLAIEAPTSSARKPNRHALPRQVIDEGASPTPRPTRQAPTLAPTVEPTPEVTNEETAATTAEPPTATRIAPTHAPASPTATASNTPRPTRTPSPALEATVEVTVEPTPEVTIEAVPISTAGLPPSSGYRDERWYAMNLGIIASALIITFGAVVNVARDLLRRGRRG